MFPMPMKVSEVQESPPSREITCDAKIQTTECVCAGRETGWRLETVAINMLATSHEVMGGQNNMP